MAFDINNIKEIGGPGNSQDGGQSYSLFSKTDTIATMLAEGYLDPLAFKLQLRDVIFLTGTDGAIMAQVESISSSNVIKTSVTSSTGSAFQNLVPVAQVGVVNITDKLTNVTSTGVDALSLADGGFGQVKIISLVVDGGTATLTPATGSGYTTITFADAGDTVTLMWLGATGWAITGQGGLAGGPVAA